MCKRGWDGLALQSTHHPWSLITGLRIYRRGATGADVDERPATAVHDSCRMRIDLWSHLNYVTSHMRANERWTRARGLAGLDGQNIFGRRPICFLNIISNSCWIHANEKINPLVFKLFHYEKISTKMLTNGHNRKIYPTSKSKNVKTVQCPMAPLSVLALIAKSVRTDFNRL